MRITRAAALLFLCVLIPASLEAQQSASPTPSAPTQAGPASTQAATLLQQSIAAQTGGVSVTDVTMNGTFMTTAGANTESGTITMIGTASGKSQATVSTSSGTRTEIRDISSGSPTLTATGSDGLTHAVATQSALSPHSCWFFPAFVLSSGLSSSAYASSYIGQETQNGSPVQHVAVWLLPSASTAAQSSQQASQQDIYLDPSSLLPVAMTFTVHPYDPSDPNRPLVAYRGNPVDSLEQITFSDYRVVQGRSIAFHTHTTLKAGLLNIVTDTQFLSVNFNSGATVTAN